MSRDPVARTIRKSGGGERAARESSGVVSYPVVKIATSEDKDGSSIRGTDVMSLVRMK
jgi:hypothetical protein